MVSLPVFRGASNPATGLLQRRSLRGVGLDLMAQRWLVDVNWALPGHRRDTWRGVGCLIVVIAIAGLQSIPKGLLRGHAAIDGASGMAFFRITLPLHDARPTVTTVLNPLYGLKVVRHRFVLTQRGGLRHRHPSTRRSSMSFPKGRYGAATTLSTLLF